MANIIANSRLGSVVRVVEPERGYVPARHAGILEAARLADMNGISRDEILILQVDADTTYDEHYVAAMLGAAIGRANVVFEGVSHIARNFVIDHRRYCELCDRIDDAMQPFFGAPEDDVIVSDFASGFWLSDYFAWGGHTREFDSRGDEVHAETSRLLIRATRTGAHKFTIPTAFGYPSRRKIVADPLRHFVTAGFPREKNWQQSWDSNSYGIRDLQSFEDAIGSSRLLCPIALREAHLFALFAVLPRYLRQILFGSSQVMLPDPVAKSIAQLPDISRSTLGNATAPLFEALFALVDRQSLRSSAGWC
jgi:hypothetical protein